MAEKAPTADLIAADVGGTFTDVVHLSVGGGITVRKVLSTQDDYSRGVIEGIGEILEADAAAASLIGQVVHATTVATNAILEMKGPRVGLITTRGFRDVLEIRRLRMPRLYDLSWRKPPPLVERSLRLEVDERIDAAGAVLTPISQAQVDSVIERILELGVQSIAVCLLNAYANGEHEQYIGRRLTDRAPEMPVFLSSEVLPELKEYERTSTTVVNAFVTPIMQSYLLELETKLQSMGIRAPLLVMQSNGGIMSAAAAARKAVHVIESGPVAGVIGALRLGEHMGEANLLTFDMGGTTAKASIIEDGRVSRANEYEVGGGMTVGHRLLKGGGYLVRVPAIDVAEVGAGGGSLAWIDSGGVLQVGPQSAAASPGPVCYDQGGTQPTVTDANLLLGYINPDYLVGGDLRINKEAARQAIQEQLADPLDLELTDAAYGVHVISNSNMIRALRAVSSERGRDPRRFTLFAFGGNGPVHACSMANEMEITRVIVPPAAGVFSSLGLLLSEAEHHYVQTYWRRLDSLDLSELKSVFEELDREAHRDMDNEGLPSTDRALLRHADLRYVGQNTELTVALPDGSLTKDSLDRIREAFYAEHDHTFGYYSKDEPVQFVNLRLTTKSAVNSRDPTEHLGIYRSLDSRKAADLDRHRVAYFGGEVGWVDSLVLGRSDLAETPRSGPLIVEEYHATTVVPPSWSANVDTFGNIVIEQPD